MADNRLAWEKEYRRWLECDEPGLRRELLEMEEEQIEEAFSRNLSFGTGGLRGILGAGTNRMNVYTVSRASQGLANYLSAGFQAPTVVIGYDSRINSERFARAAAGVFAANGVRVYIWPNLLPVPTVSYATRFLHASAGVMITASHNPAKYNGYKVYGADGGQITTEAAAAVLEEIERLDLFADVRRTDFEDGITQGRISYISEEVLSSYLEEVKKQSVLFGDEADKNIAIVYTPLNGTGLVPVMRALREKGYTNCKVVKEQEQPDGNFPTCPYPNPEIREAMGLGFDYARRENADLLLATDPDCDRVGIAVRDRNGEYVLLTGNETGVLLLDYICGQRVRHNKMPEEPVAIKTIVTTDMAARIAESYGVRMIDVLTGFKYIGEQIGLLERQGKAGSYIFGFEESCGFLSGGYVRDKDAVNGVLLIAEMFSYYAARGIGLLEKLDELYKRFGYSLNMLHSTAFEGPNGAMKMQAVMERLRAELGPDQAVYALGGKRIYDVTDYSAGINGLPVSDMLKLSLEGGCSVVVRPSGTEPKLKTYISVSAESRENALNVEKDIYAQLSGFFF